MDNEYNAAIIEEFRVSNGHVGGSWAGYVVILIHQVGARSAVERTTPLSCFPVDDDRWAIVASNGGSERHPDWYYNLKANPVLTVELGAETFTVLAEELHGTARAAMWPTLVVDVPRLGDLQAGIARQMPVFILTRQQEQLSATPPAPPTASETLRWSGAEAARTFQETPDVAAPADLHAQDAVDVILGAMTRTNVARRATRP